MGPDEALTELMTESGDRLLRLAYQLTHDRSAAEDVVQEALVSIYRAWRRAVVNEFLRRRRLRSASEIVTDAVPEVASPGFESGVVDRDELWRALGQLPGRQRAVLVLRYYEQLPDAARSGRKRGRWASRRSGRGPRRGEVMVSTVRRRCVRRPGSV